VNSDASWPDVFLLTSHLTQRIMTLKADFCSLFAIQWKKKMFSLQLRTVWPGTSFITLSIPGWGD